MAIDDYSSLFATFRNCLPLFALFETIRTIRDYSLFAARDYSLFAIRYSGFADASISNVTHYIYSRTSQLDLGTLATSAVRIQVIFPWMCFSVVYYLLMISEPAVTQTNFLISCEFKMATLYIEVLRDPYI